MTSEVVLPMTEDTRKESSKFSERTWIADSGASCHMINDDSGMFKVKTTSEKVKIGQGYMTATKIGSVKRLFVDQNGNRKIITMENVKYVPELWVNLFSVTRALNKGFGLTNDGLSIVLNNGDMEIRFSQIHHTNSGGYVTSIDMFPLEEEDLANPTMSSGKMFSLRELHEKMGHVGLDAVRATSKEFNWIAKGKDFVCEDCGLGKAKRKNMNHELSKKSEKVGERLFIDISSIEKPSYGRAKFWLLCVDDCSDYCWSYFLKKKSETALRITNLIKDLKAKANMEVKYIRCDNAGKNKSLQEECLKQGLGVQFEFTAPGNPERNGRVERKFATLFGRVRAMLNGAGFKKELRNGLWAECARAGTLLENGIVSKSGDVSSYKKIWKKEPKYMSKL